MMSFAAPRSRGSRGVLAPALLLVGLLACLAAWPTPPAAHAQARRTVQAGDGEAVFRAIFFLEGPQAEQIPELRRMKTARTLRQVPARQRGAIKTFQQGVLGDIRRASPGFFDEFGTCMRGGERRAIARCLADAATLVDRVIDRSPLLTKSRQNIRAAWGRESGGGDASHTGLERAVAVLWPPLTYQYPNLVLAAAQDGGGDLLRDDLVNSIAARLKGSR